MGRSLSEWEEDRYEIAEKNRQEDRDNRSADETIRRRHGDVDLTREERDNMRWPIIRDIKKYDYTPR